MDEKVTTSQDLSEMVPVAETVPVAVKDLTKVYGTVTAVNDITFSLKPRSTVALLGGNGAGKTTTIAMLLGLVMPTSEPLSGRPAHQFPEPLRRFADAAHGAPEPHRLCRPLRRRQRG
jgi:ABC-type glutathione transport system ATPase component